MRYINLLTYLLRLLHNLVISFVFRITVLAIVIWNYLGLLTLFLSYFPISVIVLVRPI